MSARTDNCYGALQVGVVLLLLLTCTLTMLALL